MVDVVGLKESRRLFLYLPAHLLTLLDFKAALLSEKSTRACASGINLGANPKIPCFIFVEQIKTAIWK